MYIDQDMENDWTVSSSLTIMNITAEGGGNYTCIAENEAGTNTATAVLSVRLYFSGEQVDLNTTNGTSETLVCEIEGFPIYYEWEKMTDVMVVIVSVSGNCSGSDNIGSDSGSGSITSSASTSGSGSMLTSDSDSGSMATSGSGDTSIAPYCTNGSNITETRVVYAPVSTGRDLVFNPVLFGDEGVYRCVATSDVGERLISDAITVTSE